MDSLACRKIEIGTKSLYRIQNCPDCYWTGRVLGNRQVVMGLMYPQLVAVFFDSAGSLLEVRTRPLPFKAEAMVPGGPYRVDKKGFRRKVIEQLSSWQNEIGFQGGTIRIKPFWVSEYWTGIEDMPQHLRELLEDPEEIEDEEDRQDFLDSMDRWQQEGNFVFWWCEDHFMNRDGEGI